MDRDARIYVDPRNQEIQQFIQNSTIRRNTKRFICQAQFTVRFIKQASLGYCLSPQHHPRRDIRSQIVRHGGEVEGGKLVDLGRETVLGEEGKIIGIMRNQVV
jgi:hypothetical protein